MKTDLKEGLEKEDVSALVVNTCRNVRDPWGIVSQLWLFKIINNDQHGKSKS